MRLLLDEGVPKALGRALIGHDWSTVRKLRWTGTKNGALLTRAEKAGFDVLIAFDGNMGAEQNMANRKIAVLVVRSRVQGYDSLRELTGRVLLALPELRPGEIRVVRHDDPDRSPVASQ